MMRKALYIFFLFTVIPYVSAQKLVIGSEIPSFKDLGDDISWTQMPSESRPALIDFYQPFNPTCVANLRRLEKIAESYGENLDVVVITRESDDRLNMLKGKIYVGIDTTDNGLYEKCHVRYLPYTMLVDMQSRLLWHGILNTMSDEMLVERLLQDGR